MWCSLVWTGPRLPPSLEQYLQVLALLVHQGSLCILFLGKMGDSLLGRMDEATEPWIMGN